MSVISDKILSEFSDKEFRDGYVESRVRNLIAYQIRALRDQRNLSQKQLAEKLPHGTQSAVSRAEDPEYGRLSVTSLLELASAFDVGVTIKFCNHEDFLAQTANISPSNLCALSYDHARVVTKVTAHQKDNPSLVFPMVYAGNKIHHVRSLSIGYLSSNNETTPTVRVSA